jgi:hypothetical protein
MVCPWLEETKERAFCTTVTPKVELDFDKPSNPNVNGEICKMPAPRAIATSDPWDKCNRYRIK